MREIIRISPDALIPTREEVLVAQGVPRSSTPSERIDRILREAFDLYGLTAAPIGMYADVSEEEFAVVFHGEGRNEPEAPLAGIYPAATRLALFAATLGEPICERIRSLFGANEPALGNALDTIASAAADRAAAWMEERYARSDAAEGQATQGARTLAYSPGYCGWDLSGQRRLFEALKPEAIGIVLGRSFLMRPIKSISGVLVTGAAGIHRFAPEYPFCGGCRTRTCRAHTEETWRS
jgi:hypothetical protein